MGEDGAISHGRQESLLMDSSALTRELTYITDNFSEVQCFDRQYARMSCARFWYPTNKPSFMHGQALSSSEAFEPWKRKSNNNTHYAPNVHL